MAEVCLTYLVWPCLPNGVVLVCVFLAPKGQQVRQYTIPVALIKMHFLLWQCSLFGDRWLLPCGWVSFSSSPYAVDGVAYYSRWAMATG